HLFPANDDLTVPRRLGGDLESAVRVHHHVKDVLNVEDIGSVDAEEKLGIEHFFQRFERKINDEFSQLLRDEVDVTAIGEVEQHLVRRYGTNVIAHFDHEPRLECLRSSFAGKGLDFF